MIFPGMPFPFHNTFARLPEAFFARVNPTPVSAPEWIALNCPLAAELGLDLERLASEEGLAVLSGNLVPQGAEPLAAAYAGHQFGGFSSVLGDGRAILLGEVIHRDGTHRDIQLKGSGPTPFSRRGDGRSALGPVIREYLLSEAMHALGLPTTRALAAIWSGDKVFREEVEPGGILTRVARSHLRIGTCEYFASRGDVASLRLLVEYALMRHFPESEGVRNPALALLESVLDRQATLVASWMGIGFIHGVMNTDNMSLSGETIDFGPCAFLDRYDPAKKYSFIDRGGRYAYGNQPNIALWNLARLAEALLPLIDEDEERAVGEVTEILEQFPDRFRRAWEETFSRKTGIPGGRGGDLAQGLLAILEAQEVDFTLAFRHLRNALADERPFLALFGQPAAAQDWLETWHDRIERIGLSREETTATMHSANPVFIPRNHRVEEAIEAARRQDYSVFQRLYEVLLRPYEEQPSAKEFEAPPLSHEEVHTTWCGT